MFETLRVNTAKYARMEAPLADGASRNGPALSAMEGTRRVRFV